MAGDRARRAWHDLLAGHRRDDRRRTGLVRTCVRNEPDKTGLVVLDMAGTTVADGGLVEQAFAAAVGRFGVEQGTADHAEKLGYVRATMGESKISVFRHLFGDEARARRANLAFEEAYGELVEAGLIAPVPGAAEAIETPARRRPYGRAHHRLRAGHPGRDPRGPRLAGSRHAHAVPGRRGRPGPPLPGHGARGFSADGRGRERPADRRRGRHVVRHAQRRAVGRRVVAGVLTGAHEEDALRAAGATHVLASVAELPALLVVESRLAARRRDDRRRAAASASTTVSVAYGGHGSTPSWTPST